MSKNNMIFAGVILVIAVIGGLVWYSQPKNPSTATATATPNEQTSQSPSPSAQADDTSDAAIDQDMSSIDANITGLSNDDASINEGLNDTPVPQAQ